ncbi:MAG: hypothetical protein WAS05_06385 [Candidatus Nanopelagicales bacterium]
MKKIVIAAAFSLALVGMAGCSSSSTTSNSNEYTAEQEQQFLNGFANSPTLKGVPAEYVQAVGQCVWRGFQSQISYNDFVAYDQNPTSSETQGTATQVQQITQACQANQSAY